jgi:uncharacterized protein YndB with AHSA1/START domain
MTTKFTVQVSITINTSPASVWKALTDTTMIKQYLFGTEVVSDWKEGNEIIYKGVWEGKTYEDKGVILKIEPEKLLETNYWTSFSGLPDSPNNYQKVTYQLSRDGDNTVLTITQDGIPTDEARAHSETNWAMVLDGLKKLLEK